MGDVTPSRSLSADNSGSLSDTSTSTISSLRSTSKRFPRRKSSTRSDGSKGSKYECRPESKLTPFALRWSFGRNKEVRIVNLTQKNRPVIFFASSHTGVIYNYQTDKMQLVQGHRNVITSVSVDMSGRWLVTADAGHDNVFIVWDTETWLPAHTLFNPHIEHGTRIITISPNAKYIVTVSKGPEQVIAFWIWTLGKEEADAQQTLPKSFDNVKRIVFSPDRQEHFMLTTNTRVIFATWGNDELTLHVPDWRRSVGRLTESVYQIRSHRALTASVSGKILVWSDIKYVRSHSLSPQLTNKKYVVKTIRLEQRSIYVLRALDNIVTTANHRGHIRFYDHLLRLLYWCAHFNLGPLSSINFHLSPKQCPFGDYVDAESQHIATTKSVLVNESQCDFEDRSKQNEKLCKKLRSDTTLEKNPFPLREFIVATREGQLALIDLVQNKCQMILHKNEAKVTAMDIHLEKPYICIGNARGHISLYNYKTAQMLVHNELDPENGISICSLKYSPSGLFLACGMEDGTLWTLDPSSLTPLTRTPEKHGSSPITQIIFSADNKYVGLKDESRCVSLYRCRNATGNKMEFLGRQCAHSKPIRNILFIKSARDPKKARFFSMGEDRLLVEYELVRKGQHDLKIISSDRIEQSAIPLGVTAYPKYNSESFLLVANSKFKFKMLNDVTKMCRKTSLGPRFGSPVSLMHIITSKKAEYTKHYMIFATQKEIGIQMLPLDGNPFKSLAIIGHPTQITHMCVSPDKKYLFTTGENDYSVLMWSINTRAVDVAARIGGIGLDPYYSLIEGGQDGWLFREMQDFFFYIQILNHGGRNQKDHNISNRIPVSEVPNLMRAIGFYPTEEEIENIIFEISYSKYAETGKKERYIEFEDFVRLYTNHVPAFGISNDSLKLSFFTFAEDLRDEDNAFISRENLIRALRERGECFSKDQVHKYFKALIHKEEYLTTDHIPIKEEEEQPYHKDPLDFIPRNITYSEFVTDILGIMSDKPDSSAGSRNK